MSGGVAEYEDYDGGLDDTHEEALFEVWFQLHRKKTFERGAQPGDRLEDHPHWGMGYRNAYY
jgi:hypothetical protein